MNKNQFANIKQFNQCDTCGGWTNLGILIRHLYTPQDSDVALSTQAIPVRPNSLKTMITPHCGYTVCAVCCCCKGRADPENNDYSLLMLCSVLLQWKGRSRHITGHCDVSGYAVPVSHQYIYCTALVLKE